MGERFNLPPINGDSPQEIARALRTWQASLNNALQGFSDTGAFFVKDNVCLDTPTSTTIASAGEVIFESPFVGKGTIIATVVGAEGGVHIGLNDVDYGTIDNDDTTSEIIYEVQVTNLTDGLNTFQFWSESADTAELRRLEVWRQYSSELISSSPAGLNNPGFENGDTGWTKGTGWEIVNDATNAADGIYVGKASGATVNNLRNQKLIPVAQNDRILAHCLAKKTAGAGSVRLIIRWLDINQAELSTSVGDTTTSSSYTRLRALKVAPASTAFAQIQMDMTSENASTVAYVDKFEGTIIPKDVDIDALQTTNAPAEALADVTGNQNQAVSWLTDASLQAKARSRNLNNLIENPGAEDGVLDPHDTRDAGGTWDAPSTVSARSGVKAFRYDSTGQNSFARLETNGSFTSTAGKTAAAEGDQFYFEFFARLASAGTPNQVRGRILFIEASGSSLGGAALGPVTPTTTYQRLVGEDTAPAGTAFVTFFIQVDNDGNAGDVFLFDDLYATRMTKTTFVESETITSSDFAKTAGILSLTTSYQTLQSVAITVDAESEGGPYPVIGMASFYAEHQAVGGEEIIHFKIIRSESGQADVDVYPEVSGRVRTDAFFTVPFSDDPGVGGPYTYKLQAEDTGEDVEVEHRFMQLSPFKDS